MPCAAQEWHILDQFTIASNQQMRRYLEMAKLGKRRVLCRIQTIGKQLVDTGTAEFSCRQTDAVDDE